MVMDITTIITITTAIAGGGIGTTLVQRLFMGKKDASDVATAMVRELFVQLEEVREKQKKTEAELQTMRLQIVAYETGKQQMQHELNMFEKQQDKLQRENQKLRADLSTLEKQYLTLLHDYKALKIDK